MTAMHGQVHRERFTKQYYEYDNHDTCITQDLVGKTPQLQLPHPANNRTSRVSTNKITWTPSLDSIAGSRVRSLVSSVASRLPLLVAVLLTFAMVAVAMLLLVLMVVSVSAQAVTVDLLRWLLGFKRLRFLAGHCLGATPPMSIALWSGLGALATALTLLLL